MPERTLFESEADRDLAGVAALLRNMADGIEDGTLSLADGEVSVPITPAVTVETEVEQTEHAGAPDEFEVELELAWEATETEPEATEAEAEVEPASEMAGEATTAVESGEPVKSLGRFQVYQDSAGEWRWRLVHRNGNIIATSGEGYTSRQNAEKGLRSVMRNAPGADVLVDRET